MSDKKITLLNSLEDLTLQDVLPVIDVSETVNENKNKKITVGQIANLTLPILLQDTTWYVSPDGDDGNDGLTPETAFFSIKQASYVAASYLNPDLHQREIILLPGTYEGAYLRGYHPYSSNKDRIYIRGQGDKRDVIVEGIVICSPGVYYLDNFNLTSADQDFFGHTTNLVVNGARVEFGDLVFSDSGEFISTNHIAGWNNAVIECLGNYEIDNSPFNNHIYLDSHSFMDTSCPGVLRTITVNVELDCANFIALARASFLSCSGLRIVDNSSGEHNCRRFYIGNSCTIDTVDGFGYTLFPGNQEGEYGYNATYITLEAD